MTLFYRLFGYLLLGTILLIGLDEYLGFQAEVKQFETDLVNNAVQDGKSISGILQHVWRESGEEKAQELLMDASSSGAINIRWVWLDTLQDQPHTKATDVNTLQKITQGETVSFKVSKSEGNNFLYTYIPVDIDSRAKGALELSQPLSTLEKFSKKMLQRAFFITSLLALVCGLILYNFMNRKIRIPLLRLTEQVRRISEGDFVVDNKVDGDDELAELARTLNDMCSRLIIAKQKINFEYEARLKTLEQLRHTERLSTFGLISAGIAHEIGTPLNVVDGRAKMIISEDLDKAEIKECASIIKNQAERMTVIVRQLLDFTRRPKQHIATENISVLIKQVFQFLHPMAAKQHVSFALTKEEKAETELLVDGSQIQQVLVNLLMNSVQAMPEGGKIDVRLTNEEPDSNDVDGQPVSKFLKIRIVDEGEGICPENLEHIFTPFFTTKKVGTGTGLGLSIAHGIVEEHGGWIDVEGTAKVGACFSVYLPIKELVV